MFKIDTINVLDDSEKKEWEENNSHCLIEFELNHDFFSPPLNFKILKRIENLDITNINFSSKFNSIEFKDEKGLNNKTKLFNPLMMRILNPINDIIKSLSSTFFLSSIQCNKKKSLGVLQNMEADYYLFFEVSEKFKYDINQSNLTKLVPNILNFEDIINKCSVEINGNKDGKISRNDTLFNIEPPILNFEKDEKIDFNFSLLKLSQNKMEIFFLTYFQTLYSSEELLQKFFVKNVENLSGIFINKDFDVISLSLKDIKDRIQNNYYLMNESNVEYSELKYVNTISYHNNFYEKHFQKEFLDQNSAIFNQLDNYKDNLTNQKNFYNLIFNLKIKELQLQLLILILILCLYGKSDIYSNKNFNKNLIDFDEKNPKSNIKPNEDQNEFEIVEHKIFININKIIELFEIWDAIKDTVEENINFLKKFSNKNLIPEFDQKLKKIIDYILSKKKKFVFNFNDESKFIKLKKNNHVKSKVRSKKIGISNKFDEIDISTNKKEINSLIKSKKKSVLRKSNADLIPCNFYKREINLTFLKSMSKINSVKKNNVRNTDASSFFLKKHQPKDEFPIKTLPVYDLIEKSQKILINETPKKLQKNKIIIFDENINYE